MLHLLADAPRLAVEALDNGVLETDADALGETAARLWLDLDPRLREGTAILAPTHALRADINESVREGLALEGVLHGPELELERYVSLRLTHAQKGDTANYARATWRCSTTTCMASRPKPATPAGCSR